MKKRNESNSNTSARKATQGKPAKRRASDRGKSRRLSLEGLESRQLMAVLTEIPIQPAPTNLPVFTTPRNFGTVSAFNVTEVESTDLDNLNNSRNTAQLLPFGTGAGQQDTIDLSGTLPVNSNNNNGLADIDVYAFDLKAGDIIDIATAGAAGEFVIQGPFDLNGLPITTGPNVAVSFRSQLNVGTVFSSPRQTVGNVTGVAVIPQDGRYFLTLAASTATTTYTVGLRAYRPVTESLAFGDAQILYLDWEGAIIDNNIFLGGFDDEGELLPTFGLTVVPTLEESLEALGLEFADASSADRITTEVYQDVIRVFEDLALSGGNGDFETTGIAGDYAVRILNSRDPVHRQWFESNSDDPRITRMLIGGTGLDIGIPGVFGIAESVDVGNFDLSEFALFALDGFQGDTLGAPISPAASPLDATIQFLSSVISHEAAHTFGMLHTVNTNTIATLSDAGGTILSQTNGLGVGPDGIFGTTDDVDPIFRDDFFADELFSGFNRVTTVLANGLSSGTVGGVSSTGTVFNDVNRSASRNSTEVGIAGVTVYADINNNAIQDPSEPAAVTDASGSYSLTLPPGTFSIRAVTPTDFLATTPTVVSSSSGVASFGFVQVVSNITGTTFIDSDGSGTRELDEGGLGDVYVYIDLDGDDRPDLFEPNTRSGADGTYSLNFPGPGTYTIRQVLPVGFEQTFPAPIPPGEHTVIFDGTSLTDNFDFGFLPSQDLGDAPDSYGTLDASNGASHGIVSGLTLGALVDREGDGQPSADASGDDSDGVDDEDGVALVSPLGVGGTGVFSVSVTNTTGSPAYLQAFMDFNGDGDFTDAGEQFATDQLIASGVFAQTVSVTAAVPANATPGTTFARFRLSLSQGVGATGFVASGEVEDYTFDIQDTGDVLNADPTVGDAVSEAMFTVSRNTLSNTLDVLANDFETAANPLRIDSLDTTGLQGVIVIAGDGRSVSYTPPNGFSGLDTFRYSAVDSLGNAILDEFGNRLFQTVTVTVSFQSSVPIAVDDSFEFAQGTSRPLNVLDNDVPSTSGGLTITSVTSGSANGTIQIISGGQSIRYTPAANFSGTEQFTYSVQDTATPPNVSTAQVTVNLTPGASTDDEVDFTIGLFDPININTPITNVQVGDEFLLRVSVDDLDPNNFRFASEEGVDAAFLDLLYTNDLVALRNTGLNSSFPFDITFGPLFSGSEDFLQRANANTPGLLDEVGGVQPLSNQQNHDGPVELFTIRMVAVAPGVAQFTADPADEVTSETVIANSDVALLPSQLGLGQAELVIVSSSDNFTSAIDDSFADGLDSLGQPIINGAVLTNRLDVLANDNLGPTGTVRSFGLQTNPTFGTISTSDNGTPTNPNDDFFTYRADANANGLERFTYFVVTEDGVRSTAEVTIPLGNTNSTALAAFDFALVDAIFNPATGRFESGAALGDGATFTVGETFGVQINVDDLRTFDETFVFAGFLDVLYSQDTIRPVDGVSGTEFDFDVEFGAGYLESAGVGTAARLGIIDEFGSLSPATNISQGTDPATLATLFFETVGTGSIRIAGSPADASPFQDTLLFNRDEPVEVEDLRYDVLTTSVVVGGGEGESIQNPALAQDVNNDGAVSPIDALLIINQMSRTSFAEGESIGQGSVRYYTDVNGDNETSAIDALQVINYLARNANNGEGESVVASVTPSINAAAISASSVDDTAGASQANDSVFADLSEDGKLLSTDTVASDSSPTIVPGPQTANDASSDEDDVLGLLADDVQGLWS